MDAVHLVVLVSVVYLLSWAIRTYLLRRFTDDEREDDAPATTPRGASGSHRARVDQSRAAADSDSDAVVCPACGVENGRGYTFCRRCVADLSAAGHRSPAGRPRC